MEKRQEDPYYLQVTDYNQNILLKVFKRKLAYSGDVMIIHNMEKYFSCRVTSARTYTSSS